MASMFQVSREKFRRLVGCGIKNTWPIFKTEMFIDLSSLDVKILFCKITHLSDQENRKTLLQYNAIDPFHNDIISFEILPGISLASI